MLLSNRFHSLLCFSFRSRLSLIFWLWVWQKHLSFIGRKLDLPISYVYLSQYSRPETRLLLFRCRCNFQCQYSIWDMFDGESPGQMGLGRTILKARVTGALQSLFSDYRAHEAMPSCSVFSKRGRIRYLR